MGAGRSQAIPPPCPHRAAHRLVAAAPALLVVGRKESADRTLSIRRLGNENQTVLPLDVALGRLADEAVPPDVRRMRAAA